MRYGDSYVQRSTLTNNRAADGGGVHTFGTYMWVIRSTLSGNQATADGGGVLFESYVPSGSLVYASTLNGNSAGARGGAVAVTVRATDASYQVAQVVDSTIAGNRAGSGAGGVDTLAPRGSRTGSIENSILACNSTEATSGADLRVGGGAGAFEGSFSLVQNVASAAILDNGGNIFGQDPKLAALAANGGLSKTMALTLGSPAVDHGQTGSPPISASSSAG